MSVIHFVPSLGVGRGRGFPPCSLIRRSLSQIGGCQKCCQNPTPMSKTTKNHRGASQFMPFMGLFVPWGRMGPKIGPPPIPRPGESTQPHFHTGVRRGYFHWHGGPVPRLCRGQRMAGRHDPAGRCVGGGEPLEKSSAGEGSGMLEKGSEDWFFAKGEVMNVWERLHFVVVDPDEVLPCSRGPEAPFFFSNSLAEVSDGHCGYCPVSLEAIVCFVHDMREKMDSPQLRERMIVYYLESSSSVEITSMAFLICCYLVLERDFEPEMALSSLNRAGVTAVGSAVKTVFKKGSCRPLEITVMQALTALQKARRRCFFDHRRMDFAEQDRACHDRVHFLTVGPHTALIEGQWRRDSYLSWLAQRGVTDLIRLRQRRGSRRHGETIDGSGSGSSSGSSSSSIDDETLAKRGIQVHVIEHDSYDESSSIRDAALRLDEIVGGHSGGPGVCTMVIDVGVCESSKAVGMCLLGRMLVFQEQFTLPEALYFLSQCDTNYQRKVSWIKPLMSFTSTMKESHEPDASFDHAADDILSNTPVGPLSPKVRKFLTAVLDTTMHSSLVSDMGTRDGNFAGIGSGSAVCEASNHPLDDDSVDEMKKAGKTGIEDKSIRADATPLSSGMDVPTSRSGRSGCPIDRVIFVL